jgi:hypothetical protein
MAPFWKLMEMLFLDGATRAHDHLCWEPFAPHREHTMHAGEEVLEVKVLLQTWNQCVGDD